MVDPNQKDKQRRLMLWLLIPWMISIWWMMQKQKQAMVEKADTQSAVAEASPLADIEREPDLERRISELESFCQATQQGPDAQRAQMLLAIAYEAQGAAAVEKFEDWSPYKKAADTYEAFYRRHRSSPWAAHAAFRAALVYESHIPGGEKKMVKLLAGLAFDNRPVWVYDETDGLWHEKRALLASGAIVEPHVQDQIRYRVLDLLVTVFGGRGSPHSYVLALITLAVIVKLIVLPLGIRGHVAMKTMQAKMAKVQPELDEIKKRYKDDQMALMREQSRIMKENGVSMTGGCLPQLIQLPFIIYVYYAIRLYAHHFSNGQFFWIHDLSMPDMPLLIIYAASMIATTKLTPQPPSADPNQQSSQKMITYFMPVMLIFVLRTLPSAFIFYWAAFNIIATAQQIWLNKAYPGTARSDNAAPTPKPARLGKREREAAREELAAQADAASRDGRASRGLLGRLLGLPGPDGRGGGEEGDGERKAIRARGKTRKPKKRRPPDMGPTMPPRLR
jgi:YidC/Oxa1 family membrane protein insertase